MLILFARRLSPRSRMIAGAIFAVLGLAEIAVAAVLARGFIIHGIVVTAIGAAVLASGYVTQRRARVASQ
jgi:hypothetical protein